MTQADVTALEPVSSQRFAVHSAGNPQYAQEIIRVENVSKTYHLGEVDVPVTQRRVVLHSARRNGGADGGLRVGQDYADEYLGVSRPTQCGEDTGSTVRR